MTNEHTPGPWTFVLLNPAPLAGFAYGIGHDPLGPSDIPWPTALAVTDADARIIAAAPAMVEALEAMIEFYVVQHSFKCERNCDTPDAQARAAISKAKS